MSFISGRLSPTGEDMMFWTDVQVKKLHKMGYQVLNFTDGETAIHHSKGFKPDQIRVAWTDRGKWIFAPHCPDALRCLLEEWTKSKPSDPYESSGPPMGWLSGDPDY